MPKSTYHFGDAPCTVRVNGYKMFLSNANVELGVISQIGKGVQSLEFTALDDTVHDVFGIEFRKLVNDIATELRLGERPKYILERYHGRILELSPSGREEHGSVVFELDGEPDPTPGQTFKGLKDTVISLRQECERQALLAADANRAKEGWKVEALHHLEELNRVKALHEAALAAYEESRQAFNALKSELADVAGAADPEGLGLRFAPGELAKFVSGLRRKRDLLAEKLSQVEAGDAAVAESDEARSGVHTAALSIVEEFRKLYPGLSVIWGTASEKPRKVGAHPALGMPYDAEWAKTLADGMGASLGDVYADLAMAFGKKTNPCVWQRRFETLFEEIEKRHGIARENLIEMKRVGSTAALCQQQRCRGAVNSLRNTLAFAKRLNRVLR